MSNDAKVSTDGISKEEFEANYKPKYSFSLCDMCETCGKFYPLDILKHTTLGRACMHCLHFLSTTLTNVNISHSIEEYIEKCESDHVKETCKFSGECILCSNKSIKTEEKQVVKIRKPSKVKKYVKINSLKPIVDQTINITI